MTDTTPLATLAVLAFLAWAAFFIQAAIRNRRKS